MAARIYAIDLGDAAAGATQGATDVEGIDQKIASMLGTDARELTITDLAIHPVSKNAFLSRSADRARALEPSCCASMVPERSMWSRSTSSSTR